MTHGDGWSPSGGPAEPDFLPASGPIRFRTAPTYWRCEPSWIWHARPLNDHLLWCVLEGAGEMRLGDRRTALRPGTCVVFAPGDAPVASHDPRNRLLVFGMHFTVDTPAGVPRVVPPGQWCQVRDPALLASLARRCEAGYRRGDELGRRHSELCLTQLLCLLWEDATQPVTGPVDTLLDEIVQMIRQDPGRRWTVAELAARAGLSRAQFTRRFAAYTGEAPGWFLIGARINRARQLLSETSMSVSQVASTLGYADLASFSHQYKRHTGSPPTLDR